MANQNQAGDLEALGTNLTAIGEILPRLGQLDPAAISRPRWEAPRIIPKPAERLDEPKADNTPDMNAHHARFIELTDAFIAANDQAQAKNGRLQREMREMEYKHERHSRDVFRILEELRRLSHQHRLRSVFGS